MRPQHTGRDGTATVNPASSSTATAATATSGWKLLVKVSGHRMTFSPACRVPRLLCHRVNRSRANCGSSRCWSIPPAALISRPSSGARPAALTRPGARAASSAATGSQPIE